MQVVTPLAESTAISFVLVAPWVAALRPRTLSLMIGATAVAAGALAIEYVATLLLGMLYADVLVLLLIAPATEELLKFLASGATGASYSSAAGSGIGFAATENALYIFGAWGEPTGVLIVLIAVRAFTDPLLHATAATLSTLSWRGVPWGLPSAVLLHALWNLSTLYAEFVSPVGGLVLLVAASLALLGVLLLVRRSPAVRDLLSGDWRLAPVPGELQGAHAG